MTAQRTLEGVDALDAALRGAVAVDTEREIRTARADADAVVRGAQRDAEELVDRARREAEAIADATSARERVALRREVTRTTLGAEQALISDIEARVCDGILGLRDAPDYGRLLDGLELRARAQLGAGATITRDPPGEGGVVAEAAGRRVDYTLPALARLALADLGKPIEELLT